MTATPAPVEGHRESERVEAFSDGVMAVIITIMAFSLQAPNGSSLSALRREAPHLLVYVLSFTAIGIYWNNHHQLFRITQRISGGVMWANLHLLFWLSLIPFLTEWVGDHGQASAPASVYGFAALGAGVAYYIMVRAIIRCNGRDSAVASAIGTDFKGIMSVVMYGAGVGLAWISPWIAYGLYVAVAVTWFVPDPRLSRKAMQA